MNNFTTNIYEMKREILKFSKKISNGTNKTTTKFVMDMQYGLAKSQSCLISDISRSLDEDIKLKNTIERICDNLVRFRENDKKIIKENYFSEIKEYFGDNQIAIFDDSDISKRYGKKFEKPLPPLAQEKAKEKIAILYNRFEEIKTAEQENSPYFYLLYYIFLEKVRKFYHQLHGLPEVQTAKVFKVYTDPEYQEAFYRDRLPEEEFIAMFLNAAATPRRNQEELLQLASNLFQYTIKAIPFDRENHRIYIKSRNK